MRAFLATLFCASAVAAQAEQLFDGNRLKDLCASNKEAVEAYVAGWHDKREVDGLFARMTLQQPEAARMAEAINESSCLSDAATLAELTDAVCDYVTGHERELSHKANGLVAAGAKDRFPCE